MNAKRMHWHLPQLDAIRGIAVIGVLLVHSSFWQASETFPFRWRWLNEFVFSGQRGVQLFFLASAFTLYLSYDRRRQERRPTLNFFIRRIFRITPVFYLALGLTLLLWRSYAGPWWTVALSAFYLNGLAPSTVMHGAVGSWSIATEFLFYILLPLGFKYVRTLPAATAAFGLTFLLRVILIAAFGTSFPNLEFFRFLSLAANLPIFSIGIMTYFLWRDWLSHSVQAIGVRDTRMLSAAALTTAIVLYVERPPSEVEYLVNGTLPFVFLMIALLLWPWAGLVNAVTRFLGRISFSVYLLHFYVRKQIGDFLTSRYQGTSWYHHSYLIVPPIFCATLLITLPLAYLSWLLIEEPGIRLGRQWIDHLEGRATVANRGNSEANTMAATRSDEQF